jgi:hypothetical protein
MRQTFLIIAFSFFLTTCQTSGTRTENESSIQIKDIKSIINGNWYEPTYIADIQKTKSPFKSQNALVTMVELDIDLSKAIGDTLEVGAPSIHEGTSFRITFTPGLAPNSVQTDIIDYENETNFYELGYSISTKDTTILIYHYDKNKKLLGQMEYQKAPENYEGALQYMVNKTLFSGNYKTVDSCGQTLTLNFSNDGILTGLPNFKKFYVLTDFVAGPENNLDEVCFEIQTNNQICYAFEIKGDTIILYDTKESDDHNDLLLGQLKYKLIKQ